MKQNIKTELLTKNGVSLVLPFCLITCCFALWGFANDVTSPMVKAFSKIFRMSVTEGAMVQVAFYLGYFAMAFPAALFIQRRSFKAGVMVGLSLFAISSLLFLPAKQTGLYFPFLLAYFVLTCGLSFLETSCNPYIYCMGSEETATQRLNLAQAFNPIGNLLGMWVAMQFVQAKMSPMTSVAREQLSDVPLSIDSQREMMRLAEYVMEDYPLNNIRLGVANPRGRIEHASASDEITVLYDSFGFELASASPHLDTSELHFTPFSTPRSYIAVGFLYPKKARPNTRARHVIEALRYHLRTRYADYLARYPLP